MHAAFIRDKYNLAGNDIKGSYGLSVDNDGGGGSLLNLKKGQLVKGIIVSVNDKVTIDIYGRDVTAPRNIFDDVKVGEAKTFEVVRLYGKTIELALYDRSKTSRQSFKAFIDSIPNWDLVMEKKDEAAKKDRTEAKCKETAGKLADIGSRLTEKDFSRLESEGFHVFDFSVNGLYEALNRIKNTDVTKGAAHTIRGREGLRGRDELGALLKAENIPATADNISKIQKALAMSEAVPFLDDKAMKYLIMTNSRPTVENIYKARYSGSSKNSPITDKQWEELSAQAAQIIAQAGYEVTQENLNTARWLVDNRLPLTEESFTYIKELEDIKLKSSPELILGKWLEGMRQGADPKDVVISDGPEASAARLIQDISCIRDEAVTEAVHSGTELTIRNLARIQERLHGNPKDAGAGSSGAYSAVMADAEEAHAANADVKETSDAGSKAGQEYAPEENTAPDAVRTGYAAGEYIDENRLKEIRVRRQLEEIRLKMTLETAVTLARKGIKVDTMELSRVVDALRELENSYYERYFREADVIPSEESINILRETAGSIQQLKSVPCYVLGSTLQNRFTQTIPGLLEEGKKILPAFEQAGAAYEALMTAPNREYGDSIHKAFGNISTILEELGMESTEVNQRAVRILAYNRMEINEENIRQVKAYDLQVNELIKNLHPAVAVRLIKEGINPLDMPIYELNKEIDNIRRKEGISAEEKYSSFLRRLEKSGDITESERKAFIGIYRLLYNIEKSDGAAIGAVLKTGRKLTLDNLLSAVMTGKKGKLDAVVNDEFGMLDGIRRDREAIAEQLSMFQEGDQDKEGLLASADEQIDYYNCIVARLKDELSPGMLKKALQERQQADGRPDEAGSYNMQHAGSGGSSDEIWDFIKDLPLEKLLQIQSKQQGDKAEVDEAYQELVKDIRQICKNAEQAIRFLNDFEIPSTPMNLLYAQQLLNNTESPFRKMIKLAKEKNVGKINNNVKEIYNFTDKLIGSQSMEEAYADLEEAVNDSLEEICSQEQADSIVIDRFVSLRQQFGFLKKLAAREFYQIPVLTERGITDINLTIVRKAQSFGELMLTTSSENLGSIKAELVLKADELTGYISCDNREGLDRLRKGMSGLMEAARDNNVSIGQIDYVLIKKDAAAINPRQLQDQSQTKNPDTERILYNMAKALLNVISLAEGNE